MKLPLLLLCAGKATRMGNSCEDKALFPLGPQSALERLLSLFQSTHCVSQVLCVAQNTSHIQKLQQQLKPHLSSNKHYRFHASTPSIKLQFCTGGTTRGQSVLKGLQQLPTATEKVIIHDVARSLLRPQCLHILLQAAQQYTACALAAPITDTLAFATQKHILKHLARENLYTLETPQIHPFALLKTALKTALKQGGEPTDESSILTPAGQKVHLITHPHPNPKLTHPADKKLFRALAKTFL